MRADNRHPQLSSWARNHARSMPPMPLRDKTLIAGIIVGFGLLHIVGGTMLRAAADRPPIESAAPVLHGD